MKRKMVMAFLLSSVIVLSGMTVLPGEMTGTLTVYADETDSSTVWEDLKASFAEKLLAEVAAETDGKTSAEILALGVQYETGDGVTLWYAKAMAMYEAALEAAEEGSEDAVNAQNAIDALEAFKQEKLAEGVQGFVFTYFREGVSASQDGNYAKTYCVYYDDAFFFEEEENRGIGSLGDLLRDGVDGIVEQDMEKAIAVYTYCAEVLGKGNGYTSLGLLYSAEDGTYEGISHSDETAMEYFLKSFDEELCTGGTDFKGPRYAGNLYDSGYYMDDGTWVEPDYAKAEECYLIAVAGNGRTYDATAAFKLGAYYAEGRTDSDGNVVIEQDLEKAFEYYLLAVSDSSFHYTMLGAPQCLLTLAECYENGYGVEADTALALEYYQMALEAAEENLALENKGSSDEDMLAVKEAAETAIAALTADSDDTAQNTENDTGTDTNTDTNTDTDTDANTDTDAGSEDGTVTDTDEDQTNDTKTASTPQTGDHTNALIPGMLSLLSAAILALLGLVKHRRV